MTKALPVCTVLKEQCTLFLWVGVDVHAKQPAAAYLNGVCSSRRCVCTHAELQLALGPARAGGRFNLLRALPNNCAPGA